MYVNDILSRKEIRVDYYHHVRLVCYVRTVIGLSQTDVRTDYRRVALLLLMSTPRAPASR